MTSDQTKQVLIIGRGELGTYPLTNTNGMTITTVDKYDPTATRQDDADTLGFWEKIAELDVKFDIIVFDVSVVKFFNNFGSNPKDFLKAIANVLVEGGKFVHDVSGVFHEEQTFFSHSVNPFTEYTRLIQGRESFGLENIEPADLTEEQETQLNEYLESYGQDDMQNHEVKHRLPIIEEQGLFDYQVVHGKYPVIDYSGIKHYVYTKKSALKN